MFHPRQQTPAATTTTTAKTEMPSLNLPPHLTIDTANRQKPSLALPTPGPMTTLPHLLAPTPSHAPYTIEPFTGHQTWQSAYPYPSPDERKQSAGARKTLKKKEWVESLNKVCTNNNDFGVLIMNVGGGGLGRVQ